MKTLTEKFNEVTVKKGETFEISLEGNATTGYSWEFKVVAGKASLVNEDYIVDPSPPGEFWCGVGGRQFAAFKADEKGKIEIQAEYKRPWAKNDAPAKSQTFKITVK
jgi:inhibitor of cysteine peptidase